MGTEKQTTSTDATVAGAKAQVMPTENLSVASKKPATGKKVVTISRAEAAERWAKRIEVSYQHNVAPKLNEQWKANFVPRSMTLLSDDSVQVQGTSRDKSVYTVGIIIGVKFLSFSFSLYICILVCNCNLSFFFPYRSESLIGLVLVLYILLHHVEWLSDWLYVTDPYNGVVERENVAQLVVNDYRKYSREFLISKTARTSMGLARSHLRDSGVLVLVVALEMLDVGTTLMVEGGFHGVVGDGNFHTYVIRDPPVAITTGLVDKKSVNKNCAIHLLIGSKT